MRLYETFVPVSGEGGIAYMGVGMEPTYHASVQKKISTTFSYRKLPSRSSNRGKRPAEHG
jgi:hypothetical protein